MEQACLMNYYFFDRDLSWLSFNERVLIEAEDKSVPLLERLNFLSIYSSNLDEFFRVRMPAINALHKLHTKEKLSSAAAGKYPDIAEQVRTIINHQQNLFGKILRKLIPQLQEHGIELLYGTPVPKEIMPQISHYFFTEVLAFLRPVVLTEDSYPFFAENNRLYLAVIGKGRHKEDTLAVVNIPSESMSRFYTVEYDGKRYIVFLDDIIKMHLHVLPGIIAESSYSFKVTRDAELYLDDAYEHDIAAKIEKQIEKRDSGLATRFLHEPGIPDSVFPQLIAKLGLTEAIRIEGGRYHNLKDLNTCVTAMPHLKYEKWPAVQHAAITENSFLDRIDKEDILLHTPYQSYDAVLRFFNEAAIREDVHDIYLTMYRVATDSRIVHALLSAAHNGKKVTVIIELKARFDEANNLKWAKRLKKAGVQVIYTARNLKVHAKLALLKRKNGGRTTYAGLLATGNLNETTARFYTDHVLFTAHYSMLQEVESLFNWFEQNDKEKETLSFGHLLVARHNMQEGFLDLIDREISHATKGLPAAITIKLNNLEERVLIRKLYDASKAGVKIRLIVRSICCIVPGITAMSENITVKRIVDRYLEHGRIYLFHNNGENDLFLGSADWMNRNVYKRIEVCFPIYDKKLKAEIIDVLDMQWRDQIKAVELDEKLQNVRYPPAEGAVESQKAIYRRFAGEPGS